MTSYNATVELSDRYSSELAAALVDELADYHPAASRNEHGHPEVVLTVQAETVRQAAMTAIAVVQAAGHETYSLEVLPTDEFDRRLGLEPVPELLSVSEAAEELGVSRQAVQQRIDAGSLPAQRVGSTYALPRVAVSNEAAKALQRTLGNVDRVMNSSAMKKQLEASAAVAASYDKVMNTPAMQKHLKALSEMLAKLDKTQIRGLRVDLPSQEVKKRIAESLQDSKAAVAAWNQLTAYQPESADES